MRLKPLAIEVSRAADPEMVAAMEASMEAIATKRWNDEVEDMIAVAARGAKKARIGEKDDEEEDRIRYQKNRSQALGKVLNPVKLSESTEKEYNAIFFPKTKTDVLEPLEYISKLGIYVFAASAFLRFLLTEAPYLSSDYAPWEDRMQRYADMFFSGKGRAGSAFVGGATPEDVLKKFLTPERASSGETHMIQDSAFFKDGIDFIVTGSRAAVNGFHGIVDGAFNDDLGAQMHMSQEQMSQDSYYTNTLASARCQQVINTYIEVLDILFGPDKWKKMAFGGGMERMSLTFDPSNIQSRIEAGLGFQLPQLRKLMPSPISGNTRLKYCHMAISAAPLTRWLQRAPDTEEKLQLAMENMSDLYKAFGFSIGVCPVISIPREIAEYICQAQVGEQLSYVSLTQWFSIWSRQLLVPKSSKSVVGGRLKAVAIPRYVLPLSKAMAATAVRKQEGMYSEPGRTDSNGLYINHKGLPEVLPSADDRDSIAVAAEYEQRSEELLRTVFQSGLVAKVAGSKIQGQVRELLRSNGVSLEEVDTYNNNIDSYKKDFAGSTLYYDWDTNLHYTVSADAPTVPRARSLSGSARPTSTVIADLLGFDFARPGERPIRKLAFETLYMIHPDTYSGQKKTPEEMMLPQNMFSELNARSPFTSIFSTYCYLLGLGKVQSLDEITAAAIDELNIQWEPNVENNDQWDIYQTLINKEKKPNIGPNYFNEQTAVSWLLSMMRATWNESTVARGSVTQRSLQKLSQVSGSNYYDMVEQLPYRFDPMNDPLGDIAKAYLLIGGNIFRRVCQAVAGADKKALFGKNEDSVDPYNDTMHYRSIPSNLLSTFVLPHALLFGTYAPARDSIFAEAEQSIERTQPDESITEDNVLVAGAKEGAMLFPHQVKCHKTLRNRPEFALLDVAPGGGKTSLGITDIAAMLKELGDGHFRPMIMCPDNLIPNWCNDAKLFFGNKWNMIPLNSEIYNRWGEEKLTEMIQKAPRNTILVVGVHFLSMVGKDRYYVGGGVVTVSPTVEFIKQFQPNYIGIDESHWFKNPASNRTALIRSITTSSHVQYLRLFTGTFIANRVDDALGQTSLFNAAALRYEDIFGDENLSGGDSNPETIREGAQRARRKLETHGAVIRATRKEWAFLLAQPIERFISVDLNYDVSDEVDPQERMLADLHDSLYSVVMERSIEEIKKLAEEASRSKKRKGDDDDDDDGDGDGGDLGIEEDDPLSVLSAEQLRPYLQRIERLITSPEKDPLFEEIFGAAGVTKYVPRKVKEIYNIIDEHFHPDAWAKGERYKELTMVGHGGKLYLARKLDLSTPNRMMLADSTIGVAPDQLPDVWREEPEGKVIIFTRYIDTVDSIYNNMPEKWKKVAVPYHGSVKNAKGNLHLFKNDPKIKILVANEQSIKEGHNMQMASRIIRVEWPWTPGDLEQSKSRILRPDVKGNKEMIKSGKAGELFREAIFLDWVIANRTMEVNKHARLIWKTVEKAYFDEDNPENLKELDGYELSPVRLSIDDGPHALKNRTDINVAGGDRHLFSDYHEAYNVVNSINRREFHEMRIKEKPSMRMLPFEEGTEMPKDAGRIDVPFVAGMQLDDDKGYGLVDAATFMQMEGNEEYVEDPREIVGKPVITDRGPGVIVNCQPKYMSAGIKGSKASLRDEFGQLVIDKQNPIASIKVQLAGSDEVIKYDLPELVFIATEVDIKTQRSIFEKGKTPKVIKDDGEDKKQREKAEKEATDKVLKERQDRVRAEIEKDNRQQGKQRKENIKQGKPVNAGVVSKVTKVDKITREDRAATRLKKEAEAPVQHHITLHPATFHEYLVLEMDSDAEELPEMKKHGFKDTGEYAYITVDRYARFEKLLDYVEAHFNLSKQSIDRLEHVQEAFEEGKAALYRHELAPHSTLPLFFAVNKRIVTDKSEVRPYPILLPREVMIAVDIATSPAIRKHLGKAVPGTGQKWVVSPGNILYYARNKADMMAKVRELKKAGFIIDNIQELEKEIANLKFRASSRQK